MGSVLAKLPRTIGIDARSTEAGDLASSLSVVSDIRVDLSVATDLEGDLLPSDNFGFTPQGVEGYFQDGDSGVSLNPDEETFLTALLTGRLSQQDGNYLQDGVGSGVGGDKVRPDNAGNPGILAASDQSPTHFLTVVSNTLGPIRKRIEVPGWVQFIGADHERVGKVGGKSENRIVFIVSGGELNTSLRISFGPSWSLGVLGRGKTFARLQEIINGTPVPKSGTNRLVFEETWQPSAVTESSATLGSVGYAYFSADMFQHHLRQLTPNGTLYYLVIRGPDNVLHLHITGQAFDERYIRSVPQGNMPLICGSIRRTGNETFWAGSYPLVTGSSLEEVISITTNAVRESWSFLADMSGPVAVNITHWPFNLGRPVEESSQGKSDPRN